MVARGRGNRRHFRHEIYGPAESSKYAGLLSRQVDDVVDDVVDDMKSREKL